MTKFMMTTSLALIMATAAFAQSDDDATVATDETAQVTDNASDLTVESQEATDEAQEDAVVDNDDTMVESEVDEQIRDGDATATDTSGMMSEALINEAVYTENGDEFGNIDELIMADTGEVSNVIISSGGLLGFGEKRVSVEPDMIRVEGDDSDRRVVLMMTEDALSELPEYES